MQHLGELRMAEQEAAPEVQSDRSPDYRRFFSNHFYLRFAPGDANITFAQLIGLPGFSPQNIIHEQANITLSWPQLKLLGEYISATVRVMEREVGPIPSVGLTMEELEKQSTEIVKGFAIRKQ